MPIPKSNTKAAKDHRTFDIATFERDLSAGEVGLSLAVDRLGRALYSGDVAGLTELLLRKANLFEYVYSGMWSLTATPSVIDISCSHR